MAEAYAPSRETSLTDTGRASYLTPLVTLLLIAVSVFAVLYRLSPPATVPADAPPTDFSSGRAMSHLRAIAEKPRPMDAPGHAEARQYIMSELSRAGLTTEVQNSMVFDQRGRSYLPAATVQNIVAKMPGSENTKPVLIVGHYDTVPSSTGAGDNASSVAAMLETARALKAGAPLKNDVIFLFTDCEEINLMGAKAYIKEYPGAKDAGVVLNFEALGNGGPSLMFETSDENGWLIGEFAKASDRSFATSISNDIYKVLPYISDFQVFKQAGLPGLNFAYIDQPISHHTGFDGLAFLDERSVQHQGEYALSLARHFGNLNLAQNSGGSSVYFDVLGLFLLHYPAGWAMLFALSVAILFVWVVIRGMRKGYLTVRGILLGVVSLVVTMILAPLASTLLWRIVTILHAEYRVFPGGYTYNDKVYLVSLIALTVGINAALLVWFRDKARIESLAVGAMLCWLVLAVVTSLYVPGASYVFTWPLFFGLIGLAITFSLGEASSSKQILAVAVSCIPALFLLTPLIAFIGSVIPLASAAGVLVLVVLLLGLLTLPLSLLSSGRKWVLPGVAALICVVFLVVGSSTRGFSKDRPKPNNIFYFLSGDSGKAVWASDDRATDEYTSQFLPAGSERGPLTDLMPGQNNIYIHHEAPVIAAQAPNVEVVSDETSGDVRTRKLRITSPRQAPVMSVFMLSEADVLKVSLNGKPSTGQLDKRIGLHYFAFPKEGIEIILETKPAQPLRVRLVDLTYGLPDIAGASFQPRPDHMMAASAPHSDVTVVSKSFQF